MKRMFLISCIFFLFTTSSYADEVYSCIDRNGNQIITSSPEDGMTNCVVRDAYDENKEYIKREKAVTRIINSAADGVEARARREDAIADRERTYSDREQRIEEKQRERDISDPFCDKNCTTTFNSCESDCDWNKKKGNVEWCKDRCSRNHESCLDRCAR